MLVIQEVINTIKKLGHERAKNVAKVLAPIIGTDELGKAICIFQCQGIDEDTFDPRRAVKITIVKL